LRPSGSTGLLAVMLRRASWRSWLIAGLAALVPLSAQEAPQTIFRSHGDFRAVNVAEELEALRDANSALLQPIPRRAVTFPVAVAKARSLARTAVPPASLAATLQALPDNRTPTLRLFAFAQVAAAKPTAAFAVLVAAQEKDEASPDLLADLAGMLAGFGHPNEALAFLDELARRGVEPAPPMGMTGRDALDYLRGYALARTGDTATALPLLRAVADRAPVLAEAARMVAILSDDEAEQRKYMLLGVWRHRSPLMVCAGVDETKPEPDALSTGDEVAIDPRALFDLSRGKRGRQPGMRYAQTVPQANDLEAKMKLAGVAADERHSALEAQRRRPRGYTHTDGNVEETWGYRMHEYASALDRTDARLRQLERRRREATQERTAARRRIEDQRDKDAGAAMDAYMRECVAKKYTPTMEQIGETTRPALEAALAAYLPYVKREELAYGEWFAEWHLLASAVTAHIGDSGWHEYSRLAIEKQRWHTYRRLLFLAEDQAAMGMSPMIKRGAGEVPTEPEEEEIEECDGDRSIGFSTGQMPGGETLPFDFGVEMTCEGMSIEVAVDTEIPGVSISAELGGDNDGNFTGFIGPKAEAGLGMKGIAEFTGSAKAGAYVTGNKDGITDAGVKYEVKANAKLGPLSGAQKLAEGAISFFPAPASSPGDFAPLTP
jgi:hypothetical protein